MDSSMVDLNKNEKKKHKKLGVKSSTSCTCTYKHDLMRIISFFFNKRLSLFEELGGDPKHYDVSAFRADFGRKEEKRLYPDL